MGVVPRKFFCRDCKKDRWPGDCEHPRTVTTARFPYVVGLTDLCRDCAKSKKECKCPEKARVAAKMEADTAMALRVLALVGCSCKHHVTAYLADKVDETIACGKCCSGITLGKGLTFPTGEVRVVKDVIDNSDRISRPPCTGSSPPSSTVSSLTRTASSLTIPGCQAGSRTDTSLLSLEIEEAEEALHARPLVQDAETSPSLTAFKAWEAAGVRALSSSGPRCGASLRTRTPSSMIGWGQASWSSRKENGKYKDAITIVAPAYSRRRDAAGRLIASEEKTTKALSMLIRWNGSTGKICAIVMPRRETIIT